jgi:hypothetical protein
MRVNHVWGKCVSCEQNLPLWPETNMCGPCTTGEAETLLDEFHEADDEPEEDPSEAHNRRYRDGGGESPSYLDAMRDAGRLR